MTTDVTINSSSKSGPSGKESGDMTTHVISRWYRPPEIILCWRNYDFKADVWSMGCILAEMARVWEGPKTVSNNISDRVLFKGNSCYPHSPGPNCSKDEVNEKDQLIKICEVIKIKDIEQMSFLNKHAFGYMVDLSKHVEIKESLEDKFNYLESDVLELLDGML